MTEKKLEPKYKIIYDALIEYERYFCMNLLGRFAFSIEVKTTKGVANYVFNMSSHLDILNSSKKQLTFLNFLKYLEDYNKEDIFYMEIKQKMHNVAKKYPLLTD